MNLQETHALLIFVASIDNRKFDDATVAAWQTILADVAHDDAQFAVIDHFALKTDYLMPAHVRAGAVAIVDQRRRDQLRQVAAEEQLALEADRGPTTDRRAEIAEFIRGINGPGDPDKLHGRKAFWRREQRPHRAAEPNPYFAGFRQPDESA